MKADLVSAGVLRLKGNLKRRWVSDIDGEIHQWSEEVSWRKQQPNNTNGPPAAREQDCTADKDDGSKQELEDLMRHRPSCDANV